jgi:hypothetical protein
MPRLGGSASRGFGASGGFPGGRGSAVAILDYAAQERVMAQYLYEHAGVPTDGTNGTYAHIAPPGALLIDTDAKTLYQNTGTQASPVWTERGGGSGVLTVDVQLNNAQIKALPNYPTGYVEIVPSPGLGLAVVLEDAWLVADCTAGAYTNYEDSGGGIDEHALFIGYGNDVKYGSTAADFRTLVNAARVTVARLLPPVSDPVSNLPVATLAFQTAVENVENLPLKLIAYNTPGALTGGHPDNTFSLRIRYRIVPVVPFGA